MRTEETTTQNFLLPQLIPPTDGLLKKVYDFFLSRKQELPSQVLHLKGDPKTVTIFINGMNHTMKEIDSIQTIAQKYIHSEFYLIQNITSGFANDFYRASVLWLGGESNASIQLKRTLQSLPKTTEKVILYCHSEGALITRSALHYLEPKDFMELAPKLSITTFGSSFLFDETYAKETRNYLSLIDPVPFLLHIRYFFEYCKAMALLLKAKMEDQTSTIQLKNIVFIFPQTRNPFTEHSFLRSYYTHFQTYCQQQFSVA